MAEADIGRAFDCVQCGAHHIAARGPAPKKMLCRVCYTRDKTAEKITSMGSEAWNAYLRKLRDGHRQTRTCAHCLSAPPMKSGKYCSQECSRAAVNERLRVGIERSGDCDQCGARFATIVPHQRYCSSACRDRADKRRPAETRSFYRLARWRALRAVQLEGEPTCRFCSLAGIETAATVCDHVHPHRGNVEAFWSGPFQSLCTECHNRDKQRMERSAA
jgi:hypothetical protein